MNSDIFIQPRQMLFILISEIKIVALEKKYKWKISEKRKFHKKPLMIVILFVLSIFLILLIFNGSIGFLDKTRVVPEEELKKCMELDTRAQQEDCVTDIAINYKNPSLCLYAPDAYKNTCYGRVAVKLKDILVCDEMTPKGETISARNVCYVDVAIASDNKSLCEMVKEYDIDKYNYCLDIFGKIEDCKKIENPYTREICIRNIT